MLPADRSLDRRHRRAKSVPLTRPAQQKPNKSSDSKHQKPKPSSNKHDHQKSRHDSKSEERHSKSSKAKERPAKAKNHKESGDKPQHSNSLPTNTSPLPDFIPSHYFHDRSYATNPPQHLQSKPDYPTPPLMTYNQQSYHQPVSRLSYNQQPANQVPYSQQQANQVPHSQANQIPYSQQPDAHDQPPVHLMPYHPQPTNQTRYNKQVAYTSYAGRPRPGVGVMFNPIVGTTDF